MIPTVDNRFEKFNIEYFNKNSKDEVLIIRKDDNMFIQDSYQSLGAIYRERSFNSKSVLQTNKFFYDNGFIKKKGMFFNEGSTIGIWYYFDESGKLIKEENTDEGYDFTPEDVVKYCERNKIKLTKGYQETGYKTSIYKRETDNKKVWEITYLITQGKEDKTEQVILDGKTGKVLKKQQGTYTGN